MLTQYQTRLLALLSDPQSSYYSLANCTLWINQARLRIAAATSCVRWLNTFNTVAGQETYSFGSLTGLPAGMAEVLRVHLLAVWSNSATGSIKPVWSRMGFDEFEGRIRILNQQLTGEMPTPGIWSQYGRGTAGTIYLAPIPTAVVPMEWDCVMLPSALATDSDPEAIPYPWTDIVPYAAQREAFLSQQRIQDAETIEKLVEMMLSRAPSLAEGEVILGRSYSSPDE